MHPFFLYMGNVVIGLVFSLALSFVLGYILAFATTTADVHPRPTLTAYLAEYFRLVAPPLGVISVIGELLFTRRALLRQTKQSIPVPPADPDTWPPPPNWP